MDYFNEICNYPMNGEYLIELFQDFTLWIDLSGSRTDITRKLREMCLDYFLNTFAVGGGFSNATGHYKLMYGKVILLRV